VVHNAARWMIERAREKVVVVGEMDRGRKGGRGPVEEEREGGTTAAQIRPTNCLVGPSAVNLSLHTWHETCSEKEVKKPLRRLALREASHIRDH